MIERRFIKVVVSVANVFVADYGQYATRKEYGGSVGNDVVEIEHKLETMVENYTKRRICSYFGT